MFQAKTIPKLIRNWFCTPISWIAKGYFLFEKHASIEVFKVNSGMQKDSTDAFLKIAVNDLK